MSFVTDISNAINRRKAKYAKQERDKDQHGIIDLTGISLSSITYSSNKRSSLRSTIGDNSRPIFEIVQEDKEGRGLHNPHGNSLDYLDAGENEYDKYDSIFDGNADQHLINSGATIIRSEITLTDSFGRNRVLVRR